MNRNRVLEKLRSGGCISAINIGFFPSPTLVEIAGRIGFDCVWFDMEHRWFGLKELWEMSLACRATGTEAMVRIVKGDYTSVTKPLESGATGLMIPHCMTPEEVQQFVTWAKYYPQGTRSFDNAGPDADFAMVETMEYIRHANRETFLVAEIEDRQGVDCVDEIAAIEGIDLLFIGPADLSLSYGIPFRFDHELFKKAVDKIAQAAADNDKYWGTLINSVEHGRELMDKGARLLIHGGDLLAIRDAFLSYRKVFDELGI